MGLDVTAYRGLSPTPQHVEEDDEGNFARVYNMADFAERGDGLAEGRYAYADARDGFGGGYGYYNRWREQLAALAGYPKTKHKAAFGAPEWRHAAACWEGATDPFSELINFADNEGTIGPATSAKLARDFAEWDERAAAVGGSFYEHFKQFRESFEFAADAGCVCFH